MEPRDHRLNYPKLEPCINWLGQIVGDSYSRVRNRPLIPLTSPRHREYKGHRQGEETLTRECGGSLSLSDSWEFQLD